MLGYHEGMYITVLLCVCMCICVCVDFRDHVGVQREDCVTSDEMRKEERQEMI